MITTVKVVPCLLREFNATTQLMAFLNPPPLENFQLPVGPAISTENLEAAALRHLLKTTGISKAKIVARIGTLEVIRPANALQGLPQERQFWKIFHIDASEKLPETWAHPANGHQPDMILRYFWQDLNNEAIHLFPPFQSVMKLVRSYVMVQSVRKNLGQNVGRV